jgi:dTDP-glucose 4,6-dehydratase
MSMKRNILITGGAGFIGSNFIHYFLARQPGFHLVNLDLLTYAGNLKNLEGVIDPESYTFIQGDVCDRQLLESLFSKYEFEGVIHFAAESHVDNSLSGPEAFMRTNVLGTFTVLDVARKAWMEAPFKFKAQFKRSRFHHISTDEVYGSLGATGFFTEQTPYSPNSPYSASKASSDLIVRSYFHSYGMDVVTTNCSNNYGPRQHSEKLIPTIIRKALALELIPIYGDGKNIRDWLFIDDHCSGIELAFFEGKAGETYNIGGNNEKLNIDIAKIICSILDEKHPRADNKTYQELLTFVQDRPGHDRRYGIDATKIETQLGWKAKENFESGIVKTVNWYLG